MIESHPLADLALPERLTCHFQPYGTEILGALELCSSTHDFNGSPRTLHGVRGVVIEGSETSRILQHTSTRDTKGTPRTVWGVDRSEIERAELVRVAM